MKLGEPSLGSPTFRRRPTFGMKRLLLSAIIVLAAFVAPSAHAADPVTVLLVGGPGEDVLDIKLSQDGRNYLVSSLGPLEADGEICTRVESSVNRLACRAVAVAGFEVNSGAYPKAAAS